MVKKYSLTFPTIPQTLCSSTLVSEQFTRHSKYRPFAFSAACHKAYPMLVFIAFQYLSSKAGREVTFLKLARAKRGRWLVLSGFAKYAFWGLTRQNPAFERSVLKYVSIKNRILTPSGLKKSGLRKCARQALAPKQRTCFLLFFPTHPKPSTIPISNHSLHF